MIRRPGRRTLADLIQFLARTVRPGGIVPDPPADVDRSSLGSRRHSAPAFIRAIVAPCDRRRKGLEIKFARVEKVGEAYNVGWFADDGDEPSDSNEYTREEDLFVALDQAVERRSKQVGRAGS